MENKNIAVFFGGISSEHGVSLKSAAAVLENFPRGYNAVPIRITRRGEWRFFGGDVSKIGEGELPGDAPRAVLLPDRGEKTMLLTGSQNRKIRLDGAFPIMHGIGGEDGTLQGLIELAGIPLCGCGTLSSALCMDKHRAHRLISAEGISVPRSMLIGKGDTIDEKTILEKIGLPAFVKPLRGGSSFGISRISKAKELKKAEELAFEYDNEVVVEQAIDGVEVGCAVIGERELLIGEPDMIKLSGGFFDFEEKYTLKTSEILCPAPFSENIKAHVKSIAETIYKALGCSGFARVDMFLTGSGEIFFNEVNTIPGFTEHSRFPNMMKAAGFSFSEVLEKIIAGAVGE